ncbi:hypothetical protein CSW23_07615 [Thermus scotoductus]|jgi:uncharacterized membrane protein|uniref:Uncharacterized protein n=2 Tax=Thermus scotoductus TaxID=37636 RepID=A0A430R8C2_THESC|nr:MULTISPECIES: hypothetical protein [Thermus]ADW22016.1 conserved hypothetical protein [Thermus scotoductus SA-01]ETN87947.1 hypothetical protein TNMX_09530 [Thermus sp. NMX2.A1]RTG94050.1 hypothetical protein CSW49_09400 [Thermus scotoductus]RTG94667.1 hypothetical protein CSW48_07770 [Thermus scotoductus]RTG98927.1 hypothetical protein CSW51_00915 [Thermus scotoductus]
MERSLRDILEWVVLGLLVVVGVLLALWVGGWVFTFLGRVLLALSGLIWELLRFAIPLLVLAAIGYGVVYLLQKRTA